MTPDVLRIRWVTRPSLHGRFALYPDYAASFIPGALWFELSETAVIVPGDILTNPFTHPQLHPTGGFARTILCLDNTSLRFPTVESLRRVASREKVRVFRYYGPGTITAWLDSVRSGRPRILFRSTNAAPLPLP